MPKLLFHCRNCNNPFHLFPSAAKKTKPGQHFCSRTCYLKCSKLVANVGKDVHNYISDEDVLPFKIDDEEKAYLLGFIQTDGSLRHKTVIVSISERDKDILYRFQQKFGGRITSRVSDTNFKKDYHSAQWTLGSVYFVKQMNALGLTCGKKSHTTKPLPVPEHLLIPYVRGLIDGDGCVVVTGKGLPMIGFVTASEDMAKFYANWLGSHGMKVFLKRNTRDNIFNISITREKAQEIATLLYKDSSIHLQRKMDKALEIMKWVRPDSIPRHNWTSDRWSEEELNLVRSFDYDYKSLMASNLLSHRTENSLIIKCRLLRKKDKSLHSPSLNEQ